MASLVASSAFSLTVNWSKPDSSACQYQYDGCLVMSGDVACIQPTNGQTNLTNTVGILSLSTSIIIKLDTVSKTVSMFDDLKLRVSHCI